jgi:ribosomal protein S18 acetylase RimI-like enzyme
VTDTLDEVQRLIEHGPGFLLVAEMDERVIGSIIGTFDGWRGNIYRLAVHPDFRRRGVARSLVRDAETQLRKQGVRRITALVEKDHPWAVGFWDAVGYDQDTRIARYVRNV